MEKEVDFDPITMTRAREADVIRMLRIFHARPKGDNLDMMIEQINKFAQEHPNGFTEEQFTATLTDENMLEGTRTLYDMALISRDIHLDLETGIFIERRTHG